MKKYYLAVIAALLALSMAACGSRKEKDNTTPATTVPETQESTTMPAPTLPPVKPNVPEETEGRGSTDDTTDSPNESLPEEVERIRRRIMG